jgi:hypothetical protein
LEERSSGAQSLAKRSKDFSPARANGAGAKGRRFFSSRVRDKDLSLTNYRAAIGRSAAPQEIFV